MALVITVFALALPASALAQTSTQSQSDPDSSCLLVCGRAGQAQVSLQPALTAQLAAPHAKTDQNPSSRSLRRAGQSVTGKARRHPMGWPRRSHRSSPRTAKPFTWRRGQRQRQTVLLARGVTVPGHHLDLAERAWYRRGVAGMDRPGFHGDLVKLEDFRETRDGSGRFGVRRHAGSARERRLTTSSVGTGRGCPLTSGSRPRLASGSCCNTSRPFRRSRRLEGFLAWLQRS